MMKNFNTKLKWKAFFIQKIYLGFISLFVFSELSFAGQLQHAQNIAIEGRVIYQNAPLNEKIDLEFELYSDVNPACVLYRDTHFQVDVSDPEASAQGYFSEQLGGGTVTSWSGVPMTRLFANNQTLTGEGGCTLTAAQLNETKRYLRIKIKKNGESVYSVLDEGVSLASVPTAMVADTLQGYSASDFFVNSGGTTDQNKLYSLLGLDFTALSNTVSGTSGNYVRIDTNGAVLPSFSTDPGTTAGRLWFNTGDNALKYTDNAGNVVRVGISGAGIQSVAGANGVSVMTTSGVATVSSSVDSTTIGLNGSSQLQVMDGGITSSKLGASAVTSTTIAAGAISNSHINSSAAIAWTKINKAGANAADVGAASTSRNLIAGAGLTGGGNLTADRTFAVDVDNSSIEINTNKVQVKDLGITDAKINSVAVDKITSAVMQYFSYMPNGIECSSNQVLKWDTSTDRWLCGSDVGSTDHGILTGLGDDDHTQYVMLAGRAGSQTLRGGTAASENLILDSTSNVSKGAVVLQPTGGNVGIGTATPSVKLDVEGSIQLGFSGEVCSSGTNAGTIRYNAGLLQYCNGTAWQTPAIAGAGITSLNGISTSAQNFAVDAAGTEPDITTAGATHTFSIPLASGVGVTSGTISKTEYDSFNSKLGSVVGSPLNSARIWVGSATNVAAAVAPSGDVLMNNAGVMTIQPNAVASSEITDGSILNADINASAAIAWSKIDKTGAAASDVGAVATSRTIATAAGSGLAGGGDLTANRSLSVAVDNSTVEIVSNLVQVKDGGITNAKISAVNVSKITSGAGDYLSYMPAGTECATGNVLKWNATNDRWLCDTDATGGVTAHNALTGLAADDHTQYVLLAGRSSGQIVNGGIVSGADLTLNSTTHTTKGSVIINPSGGTTVIGAASATANTSLDVRGQIVSTTANIASGGVVNFANGNHQVLLSVGGSTITLNNMVHGGSYTVVIADTTSRTYTFAGCADYKAKNGYPTSTSGHTIINIMMYTIASVNTCYITWSTGW